MKNLAFASFVLFLIVTGIGGTLYFFFNNNLNNTISKYENASRRYTNLQSAEASLIFIKDRLQKSKEILEKRTLEEAFEKKQKIIAFSEGSANFIKYKSDPSSSELELDFFDSENLEDLLNSLILSNNFNSLLIKQLSFLQNQGYKIVLGNI